MDTDFSQDSGGQKSKAGVWAGLVPFEAALLGLQVADFSLYLFRSVSLCACIHTSLFVCMCGHVCSSLLVGLGCLAASLGSPHPLPPGLEMCRAAIFFYTGSGD